MIDVFESQVTSLLNTTLHVLVLKNQSTSLVCPLQTKKMILILLSLSLDVIGFITFLMIDAIGFATSLMPAYLPKTCKFQMNLGL